MNNYKITNITNFVAKRAQNNNAVVDITYVDGMIVKTIKLKPAETLFLTVKELPISVRNLIMKKMIDVVEISETQLKTIMKSKAIQIENKKVNIVDEKIIEKVNEGVNDGVSEGINEGVSEGLTENNTKKNRIKTNI
jgi:hypothetical protein